MTKPQVTEYSGQVPARTRPATFSTDGDRMMAYMAGLAPELNAVIDYVDRAASDAGTSIAAAAEATSAATTATTKAGEATSAATTATTKAGEATSAATTATTKAAEAAASAASVAGMGNMVAGQMILAKSGKTFAGFLPCLGQTYDPAAYPNLVSAGYSQFELAPTIDLGAIGQLIRPVKIWSSLYSKNLYFYALDTDKSGSATSDFVTQDTIDGWLNGGADNSIAVPFVSINGVSVKQLNDIYGFSIKSLNGGRPPFWPDQVWTSFSIASGYHYTYTFTTGAVSYLQDTLAYGCVLQVDNPPGSTVYKLPVSATLGAPDGYSFYVKY